MKDVVTIWVPGNPVPQGSKTAFVVGRRAVVTDQNAKTLKPWRALVARTADVGLTFDCPVEVLLVFFMKRPQKPRWSTPAVKPDIDKLTRAALDGLTDGGLLADDARVTELTVSKRYAIDGAVGMSVEVKEA